jgi:hypothetical protein
MLRKIIVRWILQEFLAPELRQITLRLALRKWLVRGILCHDELNKCDVVPLRMPCEGALFVILHRRIARVIPSGYKICVLFALLGAE